MTDKSDFEVVSRAERRSPLQELNPTQCDHQRIYITDKFPTHGDRYICADCGFGSAWLQDLE